MLASLGPLECVGRACGRASRAKQGKARVRVCTSMCMCVCARACVCGGAVGTNVSAPTRSDREGSHRAGLHQTATLARAAHQVQATTQARGQGHCRSGAYIARCCPCTRSGISPCRSRHRWLRPLCRSFFLPMSNRGRLPSYLTPRHLQGPQLGHRSEGSAWSRTCLCLSLLMLTRW